MSQKTYTILTFNGVSYNRLYDITYSSYEEALKAIKASQEFDIYNAEDREEALANETPCPRLLVIDQNGIPEYAKLFSVWMID